MQTIAKPQKIKFEKGKDASQGKMIIEPCVPGYGITLGNSLRRVLLSSLPGSAIVGVKIKGATHEFSTLGNLKEDILEFVMNLKNLRLKIHTDEIVKLNLTVHGEKKIKASDIEKNAEVEIINSNLNIGTITDMSGNLEMEIFVSNGMGFETVSKRESKSKELGYIEIDSIFSPIISVGVNIEYVRVGKMTNWEKLIIDTKTDGTMTVEEAFKQSVEILIDQFSALIPVEEKKSKKKKKKDEDKDEKKDEKAEESKK
jgi:DNA-directed RNA polymerase subunit alpha